LKGADFVFLCYDMTKETTYEAAKEWFDRVTKANGKKLPGVLVAMKSDLNAIRKIENK
jgi:transport family protein 27